MHQPQNAVQEHADQLWWLSNQADGQTHSSLAVELPGTSWLLGQNDQAMNYELEAIRGPIKPLKLESKRLKDRKSAQAKGTIMGLEFPKGGILCMADLEISKLSQSILL
ncbi:hypothetical protein I7I51_05270 [Histoplasma capsulatum]|uniref:Uncharacterized protein n=1 Tax=Ajellomyces capsulatus TaxID=5037 RepID=A0A8A1M570_AJECA|nr:hypothetical protein I7I51_05270 [Histoplasma capsulatum]